uniref:Uncharacterized protein n=1 Tax=mine drainage metagenome TaxID=410659 RepID=E6Q0X4_9ZZZZ
MKFLKSTLGLLLATGMLVAGSAGFALADGHGHGNQGHSRQNSQQTNSNQYNQYGRNSNQNDGNGGDDNQNNGPHGCINPAGHERGWCKNANNQNQNGQYGQNSQIQGIITGVSNDRITILQGIIPITFDATYAIQNNNTNGALYPTRSITAYGYYDDQNFFHANSIR